MVEMYKKIKVQRRDIHANVDKYGLVSIDQTTDIETYRFLLLIHLMLSSQTRDIYTYETILNFKSLEILNCKKLYKLSIDEICKIISKVGFAKTKAMYLKLFSEKYRNIKMPTSYEDLLEIKGVGNKMAYLYLQYATKEVRGIGVDVHVLRVCNRLGLVAKTADECEKKLQDLFDKDEWNKINYVLVGFGQVICKSKKPKCKECIVNQECPSNIYKITGKW